MFEIYLYNIERMEALQKEVNLLNKENALLNKLLQAHITTTASGFAELRKEYDEKVHALEAKLHALKVQPRSGWKIFCR